MTIPFGKLWIRDFRILQIDDSRNFCRIEMTRATIVDTQNPVAEVDLNEPIHQVCNLEEFNERAVSIHIYSKPYDRCLVYTPEKNQITEANLVYTSTAGRLCEGIKL